MPDTGAVQTILTNTYNAFFKSEKSGGLLLVVGTILSLVLANSALGPEYLGLFQRSFAGLTVLHWVNDALMAIFFLFVGLELEREFHSGELSDLRSALLPMFAAAGGIAVPALVHYALNAGLPTERGAGIPMATDIAFALAVLALLGSSVPASLKIFLTALAVIDDLGAVAVIAVFYTDTVSARYLMGAIAVFVFLSILNRTFKLRLLSVYLLGGVVMWFLMLKSGVHPTIAGVLLAFAIPYSAKSEDDTSPSHRLENFLHRPVAFFILPAFALANTGVVIASGWADDLMGANSLGIFAGLVLGKPIGVVAFCAIAVALGICKLPSDLTWKHIAGAGMLAGIGFTMSIFIANLAFEGSAAQIDASKISILLASCVSGLVGYLWLRRAGASVRPDPAGVA